MKKLILLCSIMLIGCSSETPVATPLDCNCNKVVNVVEIFANGNHFGRYYTINQCTGLQQDYSWQGDKPKIGDCK